MKKISFVIIAYNSSKYIHDCITSIKEIMEFEKEIFFIDNGSIDGTVQIIENFKLDYLDIIKLDKNYGTTISRNLGLTKIKNTDYVCILDSDTIVNTEAFNIMAKYLDNHKEVGIVGPAMRNKENVKQIPYRKFPTLKIKLLKGIPIKLLNNIGNNLEKYKNIENKDEILSDYLISACWLMSFDTLKKIGFFNENIFYAPEDVEYCIRCWLNEMKVVHLKKAEIIHIYQRISKKNLISWVNVSHFKCLIYVLYKYKNFLRNRRKIGV